MSRWSWRTRALQVVPPLLLALVGLGMLAEYGQVSADEACFPADRLAHEGMLDEALTEYGAVLKTAEEADADLTCAASGIARVNAARCDQVRALVAAGFAETAIKAHESVVSYPGGDPCQVNFGLDESIAPTTTTAPGPPLAQSRTQTQIEIQIDEPNSWLMECIPPTVRATTRISSESAPDETSAVQLTPGEPDGKLVQCTPTTLTVIADQEPITTTTMATPTTTTTTTTSREAVAVAAPPLEGDRTVIGAGTPIDERVNRGISNINLGGVQMTPIVFWPLIASLLLLISMAWSGLIRHLFDPGVLGDVSFAKGTATDSDAQNLVFATTQTASEHGVLKDPTGLGADLTDLLIGVESVSGPSGKMLGPLFRVLLRRHTYTVTGTATDKGAFATIHGTASTISRKFEPISPLPGDVHEQAGATIALEVVHDSKSRTKRRRRTSGTPIPPPEFGPLLQWLRSD